MINLGSFDIFSYNGVQLAIDEIKRMFAFAFAFALPLFFIGFILSAMAVAMFYKSYLYPQIYDFFVQEISKKYHKCIY
mgnify:CR=1 FL=1